MFAFSADHHFVIGQDHVNSGKPCQDHALSLATNDFASVMVSDGCSSGGETDMGARIQNFALLTSIKKHWAETRDALHVDAKEVITLMRRALMKEVSAQLELSSHDMLATSLYVYCGTSGGYVHLEGDGVIALVMRDGSMLFTRYDWANNTPLYPEYALDTNGEYRAFLEAHGGDLGATKFTEESWKFTRAQGFVALGIKEHTLGSSIDGVLRIFSPETMEKDLEMIAVFTDGITRIDGVDWKDAARELLLFKNTSGEFAKRRLNRVQKNLRTEGKYPLDDLAYGVVKITVVNNEGGSDGLNETAAQDHS